MKSMEIAKLKHYVRQPYAWPGGYEIVFVTDDGEILCHDCVRSNWRGVLDSTKHDINDGWRIVRMIAEAVSADCAREVDESLVSYCAHCNKEFGEFG